ncbi:MAG TPA: hypothetical protein VFV43_03860 [Limnobacter sp.]|nr:hypothetical protein [Limnobacter sp.]
MPKGSRWWPSRGRGSPGKPYVSLENPEQRLFATDEPKRFLAQFPDGAIVDEVQRVPALM